MISNKYKYFIWTLFEKVKLMSYLSFDCTVSLKEDILRNYKFLTTLSQAKFF